MDSHQALILAAFIQTPIDASETSYLTLLTRLGTSRATHFAWSIRNLLDQLTEDQVEHLAMLFTKIENAVASPSDFCGGSTTAVPHLVAELGRRNPARGDKLIDWALQFARNPYNPFGTVNRSRQIAGSAREYRDLEEARFGHIRSQENSRSHIARQRISARAARHATREVLHRQSNAARLRLITELELLSPIGLATRLARDESIRIGALPTTLAFAICDAALALDPIDRLGLLRRLRWAPQGLWRVIRETMEALPVAGG